MGRRGKPRRLLFARHVATRELPIVTVKRPGPRVPAERHTEAGSFAADDRGGPRVKKLKIAQSVDAPDLFVWYAVLKGRMHGQTNEGAPTSAGTTSLVSIPPGARQVAQEQVVA